MKFTDILALAKQGYTPADIRELMSLPTEESQQDHDAVASPVEEQTQPKEVVPKDAPAEAVQSTEDTHDENVEKIKALEAEIKRLQLQNTRIERPAKEREKSPQEIIDDLARSFM